MRPTRGKGDRYLECPYYNDCLDVAGLRSWKAWNCVECDLYKSIFGKKAFENIKMLHKRVSTKIGKVNSAFDSLKKGIVGMQLTQLTTRCRRVKTMIMEVKDMNNKQLLDLVNKWEKISKVKFSDADKENSSLSKRFIEHGTMCYFNCASELREALSSSLLRPSAIQEAHRKRCQRKT